jgi:hypothetical protein
METFWNILLFVATTVAYFLAIKPRLTLEDLKTNESYSKFKNDSYTRIVIYFIIAVLIQFALNIGILINKCGGSASENIGGAALYTFIPWFFIFGIVIVTLIAFPGFKSAFSDVMGYFMISSSANNILSDLLINPSLEEKIDLVGPSTTTVSNDLEKSIKPLPTQNRQPDYNPLQQMYQKGGDKKQLQEAADAIVKMTGNMSILINQIVPSNFNQYWDILRPLMKDQYQNDSPEVLIKKQQLLDTVVARDNIGEGFWYSYTALFIIAVSNYYMSSRGCVKNPKKLNESYNEFLNKDRKSVV